MKMYNIMVYSCCCWIHSFLRESCIRNILLQSIETNFVFKIVDLLRIERGPPTELVEASLLRRPYDLCYILMWPAYLRDVGFLGDHRFRRTDVSLLLEERIRYPRFRFRLNQLLEDTHTHFLVDQFLFRTQGLECLL